MHSHFLHLVLYSAIVAAFFAVLLRRERVAQWKLLGTIWLSMVGGTLALAYLMYPFPR